MKKVTSSVLIFGLFVAVMVPVIADAQYPSSNENISVTEPTNQPIITSMVPYYTDTSGYLARPQQPGDYPGVVMIHEWWGLNQNIKVMAEQLAARGYVVLAVDLFKGKVAQTAEQARSQVASVDQIIATENVRSAVRYLKEREQVTRVGSLGWCFGGGQSLQVAMSGEPLDASVIYYGKLTADQDRLAVINWPVLGIFGEQDTSIPISSVNSFDQALSSLGIKHEIYMYTGVGHAFANPTGLNYAPVETRDAWSKTLVFLDTYLKRPNATNVQ